MPAKKKKKRINPEEFVRVWQTSWSVDEVADRLGMDRKAATQKATNLRGRGVPLKSFTGDISRLKKVAKEALDEWNGKRSG